MGKGFKKLNSRVKDFFALLYNFYSFIQGEIVMSKKKQLVTGVDLLKQAGDLVAGTVEDVPLKDIKFGIGNEKNGKEAPSVKMQIRGKVFNLSASALRTLVGENGLSSSVFNPVRFIPPG